MCACTGINIWRCRAYIWTIFYLQNISIVYWFYNYFYIGRNINICDCWIITRIDNNLHEKIYYKLISHDHFKTIFTKSSILISTVCRIEKSVTLTRIPRLWVNSRLNWYYICIKTILFHWMLFILSTNSKVHLNLKWHILRKDY